MSENKASEAAKASKIAFQTALITLDLERETVKNEAGLNPSQLTRTINGEYPEGWKALGRYFADKGYAVPDLDILSLPLQMDISDASIPVRKLLVKINGSVLNAEQIDAIHVVLAGVTEKPVAHVQAEAETDAEVVAPQSESSLESEDQAPAPTEAPAPVQAEVHAVDPAAEGASNGQFL